MRSILVFILFANLNCSAEDTNQPVSLQYINTEQINNSGSLAMARIFWATNHTTNKFAMTLLAIETKSGSNWIAKAGQTPSPLLFLPRGGTHAEPFLTPHSEGKAGIQLSTQPTGTTWRVKIAVQPILTGFGDTMARVRHYPGLLQRRLQNGDTNFPANPLSTNMIYFGEGTEVLSQEISDQL